MKLRFGEFTFDGGRRLLLHGAEPVRLSSKAVELLGLLIDRRPDAVAKEAIQDALWPDSLVTETTVATLVTEIRAALGDPARSPKLVRTVFGFGYAFDGAVEVTTAQRPGSRHVLLWGTGEFPLADGESVLGRDPDAAVPIVHPSVSREHARLTVSPDRVVVEDLGSKNGTTVAGTRIDRPTELRSGDEVGIGSVVVVYRDMRAEAEKETATAS